MGFCGCLADLTDYFYHPSKWTRSFSGARLSPRLTSLADKPCAPHNSEPSSRTSQYFFLAHSGIKPCKATGAYTVLVLAAVIATMTNSVHGGYDINALHALSAVNAGHGGGGGGGYGGGYGGHGVPIVRVGYVKKPYVSIGYVPKKVVKFVKVPVKTVGIGIRPVLTYKVAHQVKFPGEGADFKEKRPSVLVGGSPPGAATRIEMLELLYMLP
ncbi:hypothetical protein HPB51_003541 [Rhipicephalus microplus]|uniref:Uncharacterized protein n=1 Tax=Rhipicephalus microplus TaxID=6941 RepID=A0A9J6D8E2_RHIMP|nr:hypothetical protein HPB51_003541 [Rhipicephalus microplus]